MKRLLCLAFILVSCTLYAGKKEVAVVATVPVVLQPNSPNPVPAFLPAQRGQLPTIDDDETAPKEGGIGNVIIADPQRTSRGSRDSLSLLIGNQTPLQIASGILVVRQYTDVQRANPLEEKLRINFNKISPGEWKETGILPFIDSKAKAFDILGIQCNFETGAKPTSIFNTYIPTTGFQHEFKPGEAKSIIAKGTGRAKVE